MAARFSSFPSGHSMMSAVVYLTLGALLARLVHTRRLRFYVLAVAAGADGAGRGEPGLHGGPLSERRAGGWCAGLVWAALCWLVERRLQRRGMVEPRHKPGRIASLAPDSGN